MWHTRGHTRNTYIPTLLEVHLGWFSTAIINHFFLDFACVQTPLFFLWKQCKLAKKCEQRYRVLLKGLHVVATQRKIPEESCQLLYHSKQVRSLLVKLSLVWVALGYAFNSRSKPLKWATHEATLLLATVADNEVDSCMISSCTVVCCRQQLLVMNRHPITGNIVARFMAGFANQKLSNPACIHHWT